MPLLSPTYWFASAAHITPQWLQNQGITALILDVDNTLTGHGSQALSPEIANWLESMRKAGVKMSIVSNNIEKRVAPFAKQIGVLHTSFACKPSPIGLMRACKEMQVSKQQVALVGDQIFTDAMGGNLYGIKVLLCTPLYSDYKVTIRLKRWLEKPILNRFLKKGGTIIGK